MRDSITVPATSAGRASHRLCFFGLTENFHPFFFALADQLEMVGVECWFLNFWPGEIRSVLKNGKRFADWRKFIGQDVSELSCAHFDSLMATDPTFRSVSEEQEEDYCRSLQYLIPSFEQAVEAYKFDAMFFWNGLKYPDTAMEEVCQARNIMMLFGENGFFPGTMQIDPDGVNAGSTLAKRSSDEWFERDFSGSPEFQQFMVCKGRLANQESQLTPPLSVSRWERLGSIWQTAVTKRHVYQYLVRESLLEQRRRNNAVRNAVAQRPTSKNEPVPDEFIFVPFQVHDDTQITSNSPWITSMEMLVDKVLRARDQQGFKLPLVIKEHPVDVGRYDYTNIRGQFADRPDVVWLWDYPLEPLLEKAACVVTVNSSVGLEALLYHRPVITLGSALYNQPGVVHHVENEHQLETALANAIGRPMDADRVSRFLYMLRFFDLVEASWRRPTKSGVQNASNRIRSILRGEFPVKATDNPV